MYGVYCANAFKMGSGNLSYTMKPCGCAPIAFLVGIISWSVDSGHTKKTKEAKETMYVLKQKQKIVWHCFSIVLC